MANRDYRGLILSILEEEKSTIIEVMYSRQGDQAQMEYSDAQLKLLNRLISTFEDLSKNDD